MITRDAILAIKRACRSWVSTSLMVFTLAIVVAVTVGVSAVVDARILHPSHLVESAHLVEIEKETAGFAGVLSSWRDLQTLEAHINGSLKAGGYIEDVSGIEVDGVRRVIVAPHVTWDMLPTLGLTPLRGRTFEQSDSIEGAAPVVLLGYGAWKELFHGDPGIVGKSVKVGSSQCVVIGIMSAGTHFPESNSGAGDNQIWLPVVPSGPMRMFHAYDVLHLIVRVPSKSDTSALNSALIDAAKEASEPIGGSIEVHFKARPYEASLVGDVRGIYWAVLLICLIVLGSCGLSLFSISMAKCVERREELRMRAALGASRVAMLRAVMMESVFICCTGCLLGCGLYFFLGKYGAKISPELMSLQRMQSYRWHEILFECGVLLLLAFLGAGIPSVVVAFDRSGLNSSNRDSSYATRSGARLTSVVVATQITLATLLLTLAVTFVHTFIAITHRSLGMVTDGVTVLPVTSKVQSGYLPQLSNSQSISGGNEPTRNLYGELLTLLRSSAGVKNAAISSTMPITATVPLTPFLVSGQPFSLDVLIRQRVRVKAVSSEYADVLGIQMLSGRWLAPSDTRSSPYVAVINDAFRRRYLAQEDFAAGKMLSLGGAATGFDRDYRIVGIATASLNRSLTAEVEPEVYLSYDQVPPSALLYPVLVSSGTVVYLRSGTPALSCGTALSVAKRTLRNFEVGECEPLTSIVERQYSTSRITAQTASAFSMIALLTAVTGLFGCMLHQVKQRAREYGIRMAMGASREQIVLSICRRALVLCIPTSLLGTLMAGLSTHLIAANLFGVTGVDTYAISAALSIVNISGMGATLLTGIRATRGEPTLVLNRV